MIEINERIGRPEPRAQLFSSDDFSGSLQEGNQQLKGLLLQLYSHSAALELAGLQIHCKRAKAHDACRGIGLEIPLLHGMSLSHVSPPF